MFEAFAKDEEKWLDGARTYPETLGVLKASTDGNLVSQFRPEYLGTAFPMAFPCAVGGYDVAGVDRWRRPKDGTVARQVLNVWRRCPSVAATIQLPEAHSMPGFACQVSIDDLERGCVQRIEGNWRRDWTVGAALRNLNARHVLNTGIGVSYAKLCTDAAGDANMTQTDVAMTVHDIYM